MALQGLLGLVSHLSHIMQTVNTIPWELLATQREFYDTFVSMQESLREKPRTTDPRWTCTPPDPIPALAFPFFHEEPDPKHHPGVSRIQMLMSGTYMGHQLVVPIEDRNEGVTDEEAYVEACFFLSYEIANWLDSAIHFFSVRFLRDEHDILYTASKCMDLRLFAAVDVHEHEHTDYEDIYEPLKQILIWMKKGGVPDVPPIDVVYDQALVLADNMKADITNFYKNCANPARACHRWHSMAEDGTRGVRSGTVLQKDVWTKPHLSSECLAFLWVYNHVLLKTCNEAVVECMCKFVSRQANSVRGLDFERYETYMYLITLRYLFYFLDCALNIIDKCSCMQARPESSGMYLYNTKQHHI